jgi:hypothetical protein
MPEKMINYGNKVTMLATLIINHTLIHFSLIRIGAFIHPDAIREKTLESRTKDLINLGVMCVFI